MSFLEFKCFKGMIILTKINGQAAPIKEYYIAYFDLLGYKDFFKTKPDQVEEFLEYMYLAIHNMGIYKQEISSSFIAGEIAQIQIKSKVFSDNILLCLEAGETTNEIARLLAFMAIVADIQLNFILRYGLFLRGGITKGTLSFNEEFVFGQGLIDVVEMEEGAKYPRIIISQNIIDYMTKPHFVKQDDLNKACEIEKRAKAGETIAKEESDFCNLIWPLCIQDLFVTMFRDRLIYTVADGVNVLNYFYYFDARKIFDEQTMDKIMESIKEVSPADYDRLQVPAMNLQEKLEQHKVCVIEKLKEYGNYVGMAIKGQTSITERENILKKYLWVTYFHNLICEKNNLPDYKIYSSANCDPKVMALTVQVQE